MKDPQHDAHCVSFDESMWKDWPPATDGVTITMPSDNEFTDREVNAVIDAHLPQYVIAKSDSIEHLYWDAVRLTWGPLANAFRWDRIQMHANPEPHDGFWMDAARAEELES